jgi:SAM-dependent methyltransferase
MMGLASGTAGAPILTRRGVDPFSPSVLRESSRMGPQPAAFSTSIRRHNTLPQDHLNWIVRIHVDQGDPDSAGYGHLTVPRSPRLAGPMTSPNISESLREFIEEAPVAREPHIAFLQHAASELAQGATILDIGAGDAPYRELFGNADYKTCDWDRSIYSPGRPPDIVAPADNVPLPDSSLDAIVSTQVLEHVAEPGLVLEEFYRLLKPKGHLYVTTPLVWYLHEQPHDYYRYTSHGLRYLLNRAGFVNIEIAPMNDAFSTISQLTAHLGYMMGHNPDGYDGRRDIIARTMVEVASLIGSFSDFDTQWILPISFSAEAIRPN